MLPYPEGDTALSTDQEQRSLTKIVDILQGGGGGGGSGSWTEGHGLPVAAPTNPLIFNGYYDQDSGRFHAWDITAQLWDWQM